MSYIQVQLWRLVIKKGHLELLKLLIECGLKIEEKKKRTQTTALHFASKKGTKEIVKYLLESTSLTNCINDPTLSRGLTPLHYAAEKVTIPSCWKSHEMTRASGYG